MRILIITPRQPRETGNRITAERYRRGLEEQGHRVLIAEVSEDPAPLEQAIVTFQPDLAHLLHAFRSGTPWLASPAARQLPFVVTLTGTDIHQGIDDPAEGPLIREVLQRAAAVITQNSRTFTELRGRPEFADRLHYLPPGIIIGTAPYPLNERLELTRDTVLFLHPAGIRPVKGNLELLHMFDPLARPSLKVAFCGPFLDAAYGERFLAEVTARPWASWLGAVPPAAMAAVLLQADVILNNSLCEGLSNALLEAAALGQPILARDNPGNAAVVDAGSNGLLYRSGAEFSLHAGALLDSPELRYSLSRPRPDLYDRRLEAQELAAIYREIAS